MTAGFVHPRCSLCGVAHESWYRCQGVPPQATLKPTGQQAPPAGPECSCGRLVDRKEIKSYEQGLTRYRFYVCPCGREWTTRLPDGVDRATAISADEVLDVHQQLQDFAGPLTGLFEEGGK